MSTIHKFPLRENTKIPAVKNWTTTDYTEMTEKRNCNYGIVCGAKSGIIVVDYDTYKENITFNVNIESLRGIHGEYSYIVSTPSGGFHVYHKYSHRKHKHWKNITGIQSCIDIRTDGGYVVGEGSVINGRSYKAINGNIEHITEMPDSIYKALNTNFKPNVMLEVYDSDFDEIEIELCNLGFTNMIPLSNYNFKCDQMGRGSTCPLCERTHENNHFYYFKNELGTYFVKNHSNKCVMTKVKSTFAFNLEQKALIDEGFPEEYIPLKEKFEKEEGVSMIMDNLVYVVKDKLFLSQKQIRERYQDWLVGDKAFVNMWLRDRSKSSFNDMDFLPNQNINGTYNLWKGYEIEKISSSHNIDISIFHKLVNTITDNNSDYFIKWLANIFQNPQDKPQTAPIFRSEQGCGKNAFFGLIGDIMGNNLFYETSDAERDIFGRFSTAFERKKMVCIDEADVFKHNSRLKGLVTNPSLTIEQKGIQPITIQNLAGVVFLTNESVPVKIETSDRRFFAYDCNTNLKGNQEFWDYFRKEWKTDKKNLRAVYDYLMSIDLSSVDWDNDRPITDAYSEIRESCLPIPIKWISNLIDEFPARWVGTNISNKELFENFDIFTNGKSNKTLKSFGKIMEMLIKKNGMVGFEKTHTRTGAVWLINRQMVFQWLQKNNYTTTSHLEIPVSECLFSY
jgi:hypothetical protein